MSKQFIITKSNIKIIGSYKINDTEKMIDILTHIFNQDNYWFTRDRTLSQWLKEWKTHNRLYRIGKLLKINYFIEHCKDCDLSNKESKFRLFVYAILGN